MKKITIGNENVGKRIDKFLAEEFFLYSRGEMTKMLKEEKIMLDGKPAKPSQILKEGDELSISEDFSFKKRLIGDPSGEAKIIFENEDILMMDKPAGLQVHPKDHFQKGTLANWLVLRNPEIEAVHDGSAGSYLRPGIVHRLDKDTSGVMVVAKNKETFEKLKTLFKEREMKKSYLAIVEGILEQKEGVIDKPLARCADHSKQLVAKKNTKTKFRQAVTEYSVLGEYGNFSLLELFPKTGRMHQLRVHLASIGHPIVGDLLYGKNKTEKDEKTQVRRQLLHAKELAFELNGQKLVFEAPLPADFASFLAQIKEKGPGHSGVDEKPLC